MSPRPDRPPSTVPQLRPENIPFELRELPQWVTWRYELRSDKWTKVPYDAATGKKARPNDAETWSSLEDSLATARARNYDGIGFVFSEDDPYCGVDLDDCMDGDGQHVAEAQEIVDLLDSYSEVSPSGRGIKIWIKGSIPGRRHRTAKIDGFKELEVYDNARYFTVTGWVL